MKLNGKKEVMKHTSKYSSSSLFFLLHMFDDL